MTGPTGPSLSLCFYARKSAGTHCLIKKKYNKQKAPVWLQLCDICRRHFGSQSHTARAVGFLSVVFYTTVGCFCSCSCTAGEACVVSCVSWCGNMTNHHTKNRPCHASLNGADLVKLRGSAAALFVLLINRDVIRSSVVFCSCTLPASLRHTIKLHPMPFDVFITVLSLI